MQACKTVADLVARHGEAHHKVPQKGFEIWHYPLGVEKGMLYSIHVSVWPNGPRRAYLFFEPTSLPDSPPPVERWLRPAGIFAIAASALLGLVAVYLPLRAAARYQTTIGSPMLSVCIPLLLYVGVVLTFCGPKALRILGIGQRQSRMQLVVAVVLAALGLVLWLWLTNIIARHGKAM